MVFRLKCELKPFHQVKVRMIGCKHKCQYPGRKADVHYDLFDAKKYFAQWLAQDLHHRKYLR